MFPVEKISLIKKSHFFLMTLINTFSHFYGTNSKQPPQRSILKTVSALCSKSLIAQCSRVSFIEPWHPKDMQ